MPPWRYAQEHNNHMFTTSLGQVRMGYISIWDNGKKWCLSRVEWRRGGISGTWRETGKQSENKRLKQRDSTVYTVLLATLFTLADVLVPRTNAPTSNLF
mmetsp:Transcript_21436/g.36862  ORF Transcript_21436/g.36862 Transcript_21436/m.36862 type:complete len:99 (-) Transcript_21436:831-1127(-)